ncbi:MAG: hypothetical protein P4L36_10920 [Holophaga sp.]|nr:hypothetical protein [Holophaga sp.]
MASPSPKTFLRFLAENFDLVEGLCRFTTHSQGDVEELLGQFARDKGLTPADLVQAGLLDSDEVHGRYAVVGYLKAFVDRLTQRRHLVDARLIEGAVQDLVGLRQSLEASLRIRSFSRVADLVLNIRERVDELHNAIEGNLEAIHQATEDYRKSPPLSSKLRWGRIRELWENYVLPMQAIFLPDGPFDEASMQLRRALDRAEESAPQKVVEDFQWARFYLRRLGSYAFRAYQEAAHEVQPLYEQAKRNAQVALAASQLISAYHRQALNQGRAPEEALWDRWFGLMDPWDEGRTRKPFGTNIASWLAQAYYRRPAAQAMVLVPPPRPFRIPLSDKVVGHHFRARGGQARDLLAWLRAEFPAASLRETLRAYHFLLKTTELERGGPRRTLSHPEADITSNEIQGSARGIS